MLNKYPEIWLRESVMLVDLQTSSIFSLSPPFFLLFPFSRHPLFSFGPVSAHKRSTVQRNETGLRHSTQLLLISLHSEDKNALTCAHSHTSISTCTQSCRSIRSPIRSGICSKLIFKVTTQFWEKGQLHNLHLQI